MSSARATGRPGAVAALTLCGIALAGPPTADAQTVVDPDLSVETFASGLADPTAMAFVSPVDLLVLEKAGHVRRIANGALQTADVLEVPVDPTNERGLLGIAVNTATPRGVFLFYTEAATQGGAAIANRVYRYDWNPAANGGDGALENPALLLDLPVTPGPNHNGGALALGPPGEGPLVAGGDGAFLYAVIGDLNRLNQLENLVGGAPPDDTAVVLRIEQDGTPAPGNPFTPYCDTTTTTTCSDDGDCPMGEACITEVASYWAYGVRNCFGLTVDPVTGDLWDTENGPNEYDEINLLGAGTNSGWRRIMGPDARDPQDPGDLFDMPGAGSTYDDPEFSFLVPVAVTGIAFPFASALGDAYDDTVLVADYVLAQIYAFPLNATRDGLDLAGFAGVADLVADDDAERDQFLFGEDFGGVTFSGVTDLEMGPDGALYVASYGDDAIYRVTGPPPEVPALPGAALAAAGLVLGISGLRRLRR